MRKTAKLSKQNKLIEKYAELDLKKLPIMINKHSCKFELIERTPAKCLYAQWNGGRIVAYEVFQTKINEYRQNMRRFAGEDFNEADYAEYAESYPCDEDFGKRAWSYSDLNLAKAAYDEL